jgi:PHD/YefM family antitoxin component YafN of YafNO toxin-antitoxin module
MQDMPLFFGGGGDMINLKANYVVDDKGHRIAVVMDIDEYRKVLEELEELESIRAYDAAKASGDETVPLEQAIAEIERSRG